MSVEIVSWADGTDEQIAAMLDAAAAGEIDLQIDGGWQVGDRHVITLTGLAQTGSIQQNAIVITSFDEYMGCGNLLQFDFEDSPVDGTMTDGGLGYKYTKTFRYMAEEIVQSMPALFRHRLKTFDVLFDAGDGQTENIITVSGNQLAHRSRKEVFGDGPNEGNLISYYSTANNRIKNRNVYYVQQDGQQLVPYGWWLRTSNGTGQYYCVSEEGELSTFDSNRYLGLSLFGCLGGYNGTLLQKPIAINEYNFPDSVFRNAVSKFDVNSDGYLDQYELEKCTCLESTWYEYRFQSAETVQGIELLTCLEKVYLWMSSDFKDETIDLSNLMFLRDCTIDTAYYVKTIRLHGPNLRYVLIRDCRNFEDIEYVQNPVKMTDLHITFSHQTDKHRQVDVTKCLNLSHLTLSGFVCDSIDIRNNPRLLLAHSSPQSAPRLTWEHGVHVSNSGVKGTVRAIDTKVVYNAGQNPLSEQIPEDNLITVIYQLIYDPQSTVITNAFSIDVDAEDVAARDGENAVFHCEAVSEEELQYSWEYRNYFTNIASDMVKDWTPIGIGQDLTIKASALLEYHVFRCRIYLPSSRRAYYVEDQDGRNGRNEYYYHLYGYTSIAHLKVYYPVKIIEQPKDIIQVAGRIASFTVEASNDPPHIVNDDQTSYHPDRTQTSIRYLWQQSLDRGETWEDMPQATSKAMSIIVDEDDEVTNDSRFRCIVSDNDEELTTNSVRIIRVDSDPSILSQPSDLSLVEGYSGSFEIEAYGENLTYAWEYSTDNGETWTSIRNSNTNLYEILATLSMNEYQYRCVVSNDLGEAISNPATLTVTEATPPGIPIDAEHFPDNLFRQYISNKFDLDTDGYLDDSEIASATRIEINSSSIYKNLQSVEGIEHLKYLTYFYAYCNAQAIDFSFNDKLEFIYVNDHSLTSVVFGEQKKLTHVGISTSPITSIDLSDCMFVEELNTYGCYALNELIIGNPNAIKKMWLFKLNLGNFDAGLYPNMTDLAIYGCANESVITRRYGPHGETINAVCGMESLIAINHTALTTINVYNDVNLPSLLEVDLTGSVNLTHVWIDRCKSLNSITGLTDLSSLSSLNTSWCPITELDISHSAILVEVFRNGKVADDGRVKYHYYKTGDYTQYLSYSSYYGTKIDDGSIKNINQPSDLVLAESETGEFVCTVTNASAIYRWEKWNDEAEDWIILDNGRTSRLEIIADSSLDGAKYRCTISTPTDSKYSNVVTLTIARAPAILNHPQSETVTEGDITAFSVTVSGNSLSYQWQFSSDDGATWNDIRNTNSASLSVIATVSLDDYRYRCIATNDLGTATSDPATLTVIPDTSVSAPVITTQPSSITVAEGSSATFAVEVSGSDISYQWQVFKSNQWANIQNATSASYTTVGTRSADGNRYRCVISNAAGAVQSDPATLTVTMGVYVSTPRLLIQPRSVNVDLGELATFWIRADGGDLSYQWQKLNNGTWYDITGATSPSYVVMARTEVHNTQYRCVITNTAGSVISNTATLSIRAGHDLSFYGYHSIIISGKNTYGEWEMYPTSRPHVAPPEVKTNYVDLPGADGGIDYTDLLTGEPRYGYRKGSWEFLLIPKDRWAAVYRSLVNFLHGRQHTVILEDDPNYVYTGRLSVNEWRSEAHNSLITIDYTLEPFPRNISGQEEDEEENQILSMASTLLNKEKYAGMVISKLNGAATLIYPDMLFDNGDNIAY